MTGESALLTTAEVAVAFAGFASVVTVFRRREHEGWAPGDVLRFQLMITTSLSVVLFALLPFALAFFGASEPAVWAWGSGLLGLYLALTLGTIARRMLALTAERALNPWVSWPLALAGGGVIALQALNAAGPIFGREIGPYFAGLLYLLVVAGLSFGRMLPVGLRSAGE
jgi:hypothetical protein